ncbi:hypothetical protein [Pseudomonas sp. 11/12A]|uniref:hypothetical protein n=1 Tax=Pseudomonas sp. 11/12A TaxID=1506582 RepID=UPI0006469F32|nr:hypothetical protein [Pseudomonas sp. 11/12A]
MLSTEEFIEKAFRIARELMEDPDWARHIDGVDDRFIRFKNGKNVGPSKLKEMHPGLLEAGISEEAAGSIIKKATKGQNCATKPMREIARRMRAE